MAPAFDLAIRGGLVILPEGELERDLLISDGRIEGVVDPGAGRAGDELDARGLVVFPGAVDAHVHCNDPGRADWEGWERGTRGAAAGGVTTVCDMPLNSIPPTTSAAAFQAKRAAAETASHVDFALWGGLTPDADVAALHSLGVVGVKAFLCDSGVPEFPAVDTGLISRTPGLVAVHAEDPTLLLGRRASWAASRPPAAEVSAVRALARTGARVHVVHVSTADALAELGPSMTAETCPHYLLFTDEDVERVGPLLKCAPPIRDGAERERLWAAVADGRIALVASDHSPSSAQRKSGDIWEAWGGIAGVQTLLPVMLTEGRRRGLTWTRIAELLCAGPARLLGLATKGRIAPGLDADLVLLDAASEWTLEAAALQTRSGLSPYLGRTFHGAIRSTLVRGRIVYRDGEFPAGPGHGRFVPRAS